MKEAREDETVEEAHIILRLLQKLKRGEIGYGLALQAGLWYNEGVKYCCARV